MQKSDKVDLQIKLASATRENFANALLEKPDLVYVLAHSTKAQGEVELLFEDSNGHHDRVRLDEHFINMLRS